MRGCGFSVARRPFFWGASAVSANKRATPAAAVGAVVGSGDGGVRPGRCGWVGTKGTRFAKVFLAWLFLESFGELVLLVPCVCCPPGAREADAAPSVRGRRRQIQRPLAAAGRCLRARLSFSGRKMQCGSVRGAGGSAARPPRLVFGRVETKGTRFVKVLLAEFLWESLANLVPSVPPRVLLSFGPGSRQSGT